jgi:predicted dehydrogenase
MTMKTLTRRNFLKTSALTGAALTLPASFWSRVLGANEDVRVAVVGFNGRGRDHINGFRQLRGARVVALCDVDRDILEREAKRFRDRNEPVQTFTDVRKLLESREVDVLSVATPNHWHSLISIWACQAGKDVYLEKPISHNVWEGRQAVEAARKYNRIVQAGTQSRSNPGMREAIAYLHAGTLGKIKVARGLCYKPRKSIGKVDGPQTPPASVDYDLWTGPAPLEPLHRARLHYDWHWVWPTGNGDLGNQGIHQMDIARWALGMTELSPRVFSVGGRLGYDDDGTTPNTQFVFHDYAPAPLIFEVRGLPKAKRYQQGEDWNRNMDEYHGSRIGVVIDCEHGHMVIPTYDSAIVYDNDWKEVKRFRGSADHYENFLTAVRSRKTSDLNADVLEGHLSSALCHTGNVSYQLGKPATPEEIRDALRANPAANETFDRMAAHLEANEVDLGKTPLVLGAFLEMNPRKETFKGNRQANERLTRKYRHPFVVPQKV